MDRSEIIKRIQVIVREWGEPDVPELNIGNLSFTHNEYDYLVDRVCLYDVEVVTFLDDEPDMTSLDYDELSDDVLDEILFYMESYDAVMWKTHSRTMDYDY